MPKKENGDLSRKTSEAIKVEHQKNNETKDGIFRLDIQRVRKQSLRDRQSE